MIDEHRPLFIVIEGLDGSGKSTQIEMLRDHLQAGGESCYLTAEPTDLPTGKFIRRILAGEVSVDPRTLAGLFAADRTEHLFHAQQGLIAKLAAGHHVIASRYYFSSLAYQTDEVDPAWVASLNLLAKRTLPADLTVFLDLPPETSMERISRRAAPTELFENEDKLRSVRDNFRLAFERYGEGERIETVDASRNPVDVADEIAAHVDRLRTQP